MATAAEFWRSDLTLAQLSDYIGMQQGQNEEYWTSINYFLRSTLQSRPEIKDASTLLTTFLALAELALSGPLLHEHAPFRGKHGTREIMPVSRWAHLFARVGKVRPASNTDDVERFVSELCQAADFPHPSSYLLQNTADPTDQRESLYRIAQLARRSRFSMFIDYDVFLFDRSKRGLMFHQAFTPPVIVHRTRTFEQKNRELLEWTRMMWIKSVLLRRLLLGKNLTLTLPYPSSPELREGLAETIREYFGKAHGVALPKFQILGGDVGP